MERWRLRTPVIKFQSTEIPETQVVRDRICLACSILALSLLTACKRKAEPTLELHPSNVAGRYLLLRPDGRPGDTVEFRADGTIHAPYTDSTSRWAVQTRYGTSVFCSRSSQEAVCRPFHLANDSLVLNSGPGTYITLRRLGVH